MKPIFIAKARTLPAVIIAGCFEILWLLMYLSYYKTAMSITIFIYTEIGILLFFSIFYMALTKNKLILNNEGLTYKSAFASRSIKWEIIKKSKIDLNIQLSTITWEFISVEGKIFYLPLGFFRRRDYQRVAEELLMNTMGIECSDQIYNIAKGKFPWYMF